MAYNQELWKELMTCGRKEERGVANKLNRDDVETVMATMDFFGASGGTLGMTRFDLLGAKFKVYDWLAMGVQGRIRDRPALKVLVHSYLKSGCKPDKWIEDLRETDYQIDESWEKINVGEGD